MNLFATLSDPAAGKLRQAVRLFAEALLELAAEPDAVGEAAASAGEEKAGPTRGNSRSAAALPRVRELAGTMPVPELARQVGLSESQLYRLAHRHGLVLGREQYLGKIDIDELRRLAPDLVAAELAERFGCTPGAVRIAARRHNIDLLSAKTALQAELRRELQDHVGRETVDELMQRFGAARSTIYAEAKRQGLTVSAGRNAPVPVTEVGADIDAIPSVLTAGGWVEPGRDAPGPVIVPPQAGEEREGPVLGGAGYTISTTDGAPRSPALIEALRTEVRPAEPGVEDRAARLERLRDEAAGRSLAPALDPVKRPLRKPVPAARARRAGPVERESKWVRLRHPDGRWLRMDGLGWVTSKSQSYLVLRSKVQAAMDALPLAGECIVVTEPDWTPRDIWFAGTVQ